MLHFCSCFNPTFSSYACDTISEKQPKACSLAFSRASPFLVCGDYDWNGKFLELVSVIHRLLPAVSPKGERHAAPFFPVLSQSLGPLAKICQSAGDTPTLHSQQKEGFWVDPPQTLFLCVCVCESSKRPPWLCSSVRRQTNPAWSVLQHARKPLQRNDRHVWLSQVSTNQVTWSFKSQHSSFHQTSFLFMPP